MNFTANKILSPGEKIRQIRKYLGVNQQDISRGDISRSLISYLESGKTKLINDTAKIIAENINIIAKEKGIDIHITPDYLMEDECFQCNIILDRYIKSLEKYLKNNSNIFLTELEKAKKVIELCDLPSKKAKIFELAGNYCYENKKNSDSYMYYLKAMESNIRVNNNHGIADNLIRLSSCYIKRGDYQEAINFNNYSIAIIEKNELSNNLIKRAIFNNAISYRIIGQIDDSLRNLDKLELLKLELKLAQKIDVLILKGNCLCDKKTYKAAKDVYDKALSLLSEGEMLEKKVMIYRNIYTIYLDLNKYEEAIKYLLKSYKICKEIKSDMTGEVLYLLVDHFYIVEDYVLAEKHGINAIKYLETSNDINLKVKIYGILVKIFIEAYKDEKIIKLLEKMKEIDTKQVDNNVIIKMKDIFIIVGNYFIEKNIHQSKRCLEYAMDM